jgi:hypothetical protein
MVIKLYLEEDSVFETADGQVDAESVDDAEDCLGAVHDEISHRINRHLLRVWGSGFHAGLLSCQPTSVQG